LSGTGSLPHPAAPWSDFQHDFRQDALTHPVHQTTPTRIQQKYLAYFQKRG
jgi:hypothetical protein